MLRGYPDQHLCTYVTYRRAHRCTPSTRVTALVCRDERAHRLLANTQIAQHENGHHVSQCRITGCPTKIALSILKRSLPLRIDSCTIGSLTRVVASKMLPLGRYGRHTRTYLYEQRQLVKKKLQWQTFKELWTLPTNNHRHRTSPEVPSTSSRLQTGLRRQSCTLRYNRQKLCRGTLVAT